MLINKFRSKYQVSLQTERELDIQIRGEISKAIASTHALQEKDLTELDIKIATLTRNYREKHEPRQSERPAADDSVSHYSQKSHVTNASRAKSTAASIRQSSDALKELRGMNQGKPAGMTEQEWNDIVQKNYAKFRNEEKEKKEKLLH